MGEAWTHWLSGVEELLVKNWGLNRGFARTVAVLLAYLSIYGLAPKITSGYRSPQRQRELQQAWGRGERSGLRARPATTSAHSHTNLVGAPDSLAIDIATRDDILAAKIATALGIGAGAYYRQPDPGHYYHRGDL